MTCNKYALQISSGVLKSGGAANNYTGGIVSSLIQLGLAEQQLEKYSTKYSERLRAAAAVLKAKLPAGCSFDRPRGGYFIWIRFPEGVDCNEFNQYSLKNFGVTAIAGSRFATGGTHRNFLRITFAFHEAEYLKESVEKLCQAAEQYLVENFVKS